MTTLKQHHPLLVFGLALSTIYPVALLIASGVSRFEQPHLLAAALTLDVTIVVPLLYYVLLVRRNGWPLITVAPVFLLSLVAASFIIPRDHQELLTLLQYLAAPLELLLLGYVGIRIARTARRFRTTSGDLDVMIRLQESLRETLHVPTAANVLAFEIGLIYYALFSWRAPRPDEPKHFTFSYHKKNGYITVVAGIMVAMLIELIGLHLLLLWWNPTVAWIASALTLYGILWLLGDVQAVRLRPIRIEEEALLIRIGLRWTIRVPFEAITWVRPVEGKPVVRKTPGYLAALVLGTPHYLIKLKTPIVAHGLYGIRKQVSLIGLALDDTASFEAALKRRYAGWKQENNVIDGS
ncbi:MAG: hypothetical protein ACE5G0_09000 [Rhodothermales bacterium]